MAREKDEYGKASNGRSKFRRIMLFILVATVLLIALLPTLVLNRTVLLPLANKFAGIAPMKVDFQSAGGGWLQAVNLCGLKLLDGDGKLLVEIDEVKTGKTLTGWALNSSDLGTISIRGLEAIVVCSDGTSDLERALAPLMQVDPNAPEAAPVQATPMTGRIEISESKLMLAEFGRPEQWIVEIESANMTLPEAGQWLGPTELAARIGDASKVSGVSPGAISAAVAPKGSGLSIDGQFDAVPLNFWHVVRARIPSLPINELAGVLTARISGQYNDAEAWNVIVDQASVTGVRIDAPSLVGAKPALLNEVVMKGNASLSGGTLAASGVQLQCDFANTALNASLPWPLTLPTMDAPLLKNGSIDARGTIDIPKLIQAAETLLPVREGLDLRSGTAQFVLKQDLPQGQARAAIASLELTGLAATVDGQVIESKAPMKATVILNDGPQTSGQAVVQSEFATLNASGSVETGSLNANLDLAKLYSEATNWIELPFTQMAGTVRTDIHWALADTKLQADLNLATSELLIESESGQLREPAWTGTGSAQAQMQEGAITWLNRIALELKSNTELLSIQVTEPIALTEPDGKAPVAPAAFSASLTGDLAGWQRRSSLLFTEPLSVQVAGNMRVAAQGRVDMTHAEITAANWSAEPLQVATEGMGFADSRLTGHFKGLVDTNDIMQLRVDDLTVQSTAISLVASDSVSPDGKGRVGRSAFRVDLARLMSNVKMAPTPENDPAAAAEQGQIVATGMVGGNVNWTMADSITLNADATVQQLQIFNVSPQTPQGELLWGEPSVAVAIRGEHTTATGVAIVDSLSLQTQWLTYTGRLAYDPGSATDAVPADPVGRAVQTLQPPSLQLVALETSSTRSNGDPSRPSSLSLTGQIDYDCGLLSNKLTPLTGGQFTMAGRRQVPLNFNLVFPADPNTPMLRGLDATTQLAWTQAEAVGIQIGEAVVPVEIRSGRMASKAEMPVSDGALRWDLKTDLAAENIAIDLAPMKVIEDVALTEQMCKGWLKYIAPMVAEAASVDGRLTLELGEAHLVPSDPAAQTVSGNLQIFNARVGPGPLSSGILAVVSQVDALRQGQLGQASTFQPSWLDLPEQRIQFRMVDGQVYHENLNVRVGDVRISTSGSVGVDGKMDLVASMPIPDDWADKSPLLQGLRGQSLQFPMVGSLSQPQINTDFLRQFGRQAVRGAAQGLLQQGLSKGLGRLFGPPPEEGDKP